MASDPIAETEKYSGRWRMKLLNRGNIEYAAYLIFKLPFLLAIFVVVIMPFFLFLAVWLAWSGIDMSPKDEEG